METEVFAVGPEPWLGQTIVTNSAVLARNLMHQADIGDGPGRPIPSVFNKAVAAAVAEGVARRRRRREVAPVW